MDEIHGPDLTRVVGSFSHKRSRFATLLSGMPADGFLEPKISVDAIDPFVVYGMAQTVKFGGDQAIAPGRMFKGQFLIRSTSHRGSWREEW